MLTRTHPRQLPLGGGAAEDGDLNAHRQSATGLATAHLVVIASPTSPHRCARPPPSAAAAAPLIVAGRRLLRADDVHVQWRAGGASHTPAGAQLASAAAGTARPPRSAQPTRNGAGGWTETR